MFLFIQPFSEYADQGRRKKLLPAHRKRASLRMA
jgi:hypothetical protein